MKQLILAFVLITCLMALQASSIVPDEELENIVGGLPCSDCIIGGKSCKPKPNPCAETGRAGRRPACQPNNVTYSKVTSGYKVCGLVFDTTKSCKDKKGVCGPRYRQRCPVIEIEPTEGGLPVFSCGAAVEIPAGTTTEKGC